VPIGHCLISAERHAVVLVFPFGRMHTAGSLALQRWEYESLLRRLSHGQKPYSSMKNRILAELSGLGYPKEETVSLSPESKSGRVSLNQL
jgi:hypothetical protein